MTLKYGITGHTGGIGKEIFSILPNAKGFSRTNGFDIDNKESRKNILNELKDCNVFINNAHSNFSQTLMLIDVFHSWKNTNNTIINIGSEIAEDKTILKNYEDLLEYQIQKKSLKILHYDLVALETNLNLKYVYFGYVGTDRILKKYPNMSKEQYITVEEAVSKILT